MIGSRIITRNLITRKFSTQNPRIQIVENLLKIKAIRSATNEKSLQAALTSNYGIDASNLPSEVSQLSEYLESAPTSEKFIPNPNHWQNKPLFEYIQIEAQRDYTWPFLFGFGSVLY